MYQPWTNRRFGIEMETNTVRRARSGGRLSTSDLHRALLNANLSWPVADRFGYGHSDGSRWEVKTDSSCGYEVVSPAMMMNVDGHCDDLRKACEALQSVGPRVDRRCGLHVHIECTDLSWREVQKFIALWIRYEPFFFDLLPDSRVASTWCRPHRASSWQRAGASSVESLLMIDSEIEFNRAAAGHFNNRYTSLNMTGFWRHRRVEFRLHSGTIDYTKIRAWVLLLLSLVGRVKAENAPPLSRKIVQPRPSVGFRPEHVMSMLGLAETAWCEDSSVAQFVRRWVLARYEQYGARRAAGLPGIRTRN